jgi:hypothetical protein
MQFYLQVLSNVAISMTKILRTECHLNVNSIASVSFPLHFRPLPFLINCHGSSSLFVFGSHRHSVGHTAMSQLSVGGRPQMPFRALFQARLPVV